MLHQIFIILSSLLFILPFSSTPVAAADYTPSETSKIAQFQQEYSALNKAQINSRNLYSTRPQLSYPFKAGTLTPSYIDDQLNYINYYRSFFGLNPVKKCQQDNIAAQKTAAVLAAINANPLINQHNLPYEKRPKFVNKTLWQLARATSNAANLNFNASDQSAGDVITDLITDQYNLSGSDTGHRAWLLSTRLTTTGTGAAYGKNGYRYSVQKVLNPSDTFRPASQEQVTYPSSGVFPIELVQGNNVAWSLYLSNRTIKETPPITITDENSQISYLATNVRNYHRSGYGNFQTIITYSPGLTPIILGHEYRVEIGNITSYRFKLFSLKQ